MGAAPSGDRTEDWRASYRRVRKDPLTTSESTNRKRLARVSATDLTGGGTWLDVGSGDGNLVPQLLEAGAQHVVSMDYQLELVRESPPGAMRLVGSAVELPLRAASVEVVVVMDVLHHLETVQLHHALRELRRVLRSDGRLLLFEPVNTPVRRVLHGALMSPLSGLTKFSRDKRRMVEDEAATLMPWLSAEGRLPTVLADSGFAVEHQERGLLHGAYRCRPVEG